MCPPQLAVHDDDQVFGGIGEMGYKHLRPSLACRPLVAAQFHISTRTAEHRERLADDRLRLGEVVEQQQRQRAFFWPCALH